MTLLSIAIMRIREEAAQLIDRLPEDTLRDDQMDEIYVRQSIEGGLTDSEAGRARDIAYVRTKFGLDS